MIADIKPSAAGNDSGVPWLGKVPAHWRVQRLKALVRNVVVPTAERESGDLYVALEHVESWTGRMLPAGPDVSFDSQVKRFESGDVLFGKLRPYLAKVARTASSGVCVGEFLVLRPQDARITGSYIEQLLRSKPLIDAISSATFGAKMPRAEWSFLGGMPITVPPLSEQAAIVRFLDHADRLIRRYISAKQKLIKLLEEQKQAIIHRAVTRGLDPNVRFKNSGVDWVGDVPEHWNLVPNRAVMRLQKRIVGAASGEYKLLSLTKRGVIPRDMENPEGKFPTSFDTYQAIEPGDLVFCLFDIDETPRAVGLSSLHGMITGAYTRFTCDPALVDWVYLFYLAMDNRKQLKPLYTGLRKVITKSSFLSAKLPLPPESERIEILTAVNDAVGAADEAADRARREIVLLREYRTRLIADVVTGKLDVREAAARLPDALDEPVVLDEESVDPDLEATEEQFDEELEEVEV
jgi:type I restriction enzyme, S subunit